MQYEKNPKDWRFKLTEECKNFTVHFRESSSGDFLAVPMVIENLDTKIGRAYLEATMPPIPCGAGIEYVEYYYDHITPNYIYNRSKVHRASVSGD